MYATHFDEMQYLFGKPFTDPVTYSSEYDHEYSRNIIQIRTDFVKDGSINYKLWKLLHAFQSFGVEQFLLPTDGRHNHTSNARRKQECDFRRSYFGLEGFNVTETDL
ncbi:hypothetical protein AVEN_111563-1 [Araneus ventricosus]|uniref:Uncharacterized protein n=1 Tax=Araneus ventricosus TaxID=182803 RepID=A0A4Y2RLM1_ARAVE|nr:hypothetical protein AVEN_111563-1 [Araneus ventricosus]